MNNDHLFGQTLSFDVYAGEKKLGVGSFSFTTENSDVFIKPESVCHSLILDMKKYEESLNLYESANFRLEGSNDRFSSVKVFLDGCRFSITSENDDIVIKGQGNVLSAEARTICQRNEYNKAEYFTLGVNAVSDFPVKIIDKEIVSPENYDLGKCYYSTSNIGAEFKHEDYLTDFCSLDDLNREMELIKSLLSSKKIVWSEKYLRNNGDLVFYEYRRVHSSDGGNLINIFSRLSSKEKEDIFKNLFSKHGWSFFINNGVFSLVENYVKVDSIDESFYFRQFASLEKMVDINLDAKDRKPLVFELKKNGKENSKAFYQHVRKIILENLNDEKLDISGFIKSESNIKDYVSGFSACGYNLNDKIEKLMNNLGLAGYYSDNSDVLREMVTVRNRIFHNGWLSSGWTDSQYSLTELSFRARELGQLLIVVKLELTGSYKSFVEKNKSFKVCKIGENIKVTYH